MCLAAALFFNLIIIAQHVATLKRSVNIKGKYRQHNSYVAPYFMKALKNVIHHTLLLFSNVYPKNSTIYATMAPQQCIRFKN
jgi:hypothetical protein